MGLHRRSTDKVPGPDNCEFPGCKTVGSDFAYVSYAVNPKTNAKGMILCPQHDAIVQRSQRNG